MLIALVIVQIPDQMVMVHLPDIVLLNEIKVNEEECNYYLRFEGYSVVSKVRNSFGGGVAILIKDNIQFNQDFSYEKFNKELVCKNIKLNNKNISIFTLYNPPYSSKNKNYLCLDLVAEICNRCQFFIIGGDLNSKSRVLGCYSKENKNGEILELILEDMNICLLNDRSPTFFRSNSNYYEQTFKSGL
ncbi:RNA-directed DNA polymerase from mobile element jockey-like [Brachionus plicatilis]|uniref:RNA-directed DNA polymerase from mobile element jockey-like n=1 Tax=Brachionus plicatilis TaxID=10195 RepID=A0A3M7PSF7_BRAPC|nr:RNA-directed DNA polymerase from mobile element jockey-like [Brachionus plicatilis]